MVFAIAVFELHLPEARSLKQKRHVVRSLVDRIHGRFRVSIAETAHHDRHQRAELALAAVHTAPGEMERMLGSIHDLVDGAPEAVLVSWRPQYLEGIE